MGARAPQVQVKLLHLHKLLYFSQPQFLHLDMGLLCGVHVVASEEMAAVLWMLWADGGGRCPHCVIHLCPEHHPLLASTCFITSLLVAPLDLYFLSFSSSLSNHMFSDSSPTSKMGVFSKVLIWGPSILRCDPFSSGASALLSPLHAGHHPPGCPKPGEP